MTSVVWFNRLDKEFGPARPTGQKSGLVPGWVVRHLKLYKVFRGKSARGSWLGAKTFPLRSAIFISKSQPEAAILPMDGPTSWSLLAMGGQLGMFTSGTFGEAVPISTSFKKTTFKIDPDHEATKLGDRFRSY